MWYELEVQMQVRVRVCQARVITDKFSFSYHETCVVILDPSFIQESSMKYLTLVKLWT